MKFISATWGRFQSKETMWLQKAQVLHCHVAGNIEFGIVSPLDRHQKSLFFT
jgi:hypothetical protein